MWEEASKRDPMILAFILERLKWFGQIMTILPSVLILEMRKPLRETTPHCSTEGAQSLWDVSRNLFWEAALLLALVHFLYGVSILSHLQPIPLPFALSMDSILVTPFEPLISTVSSFGRPEL